MRVCTKCLTDKPTADFFKHEKKTYCRKCSGVMTNAWRNKVSKQDRADYSKEIKLSPTVEKSFFENTYEQLLKKAGKVFKPQHEIERGLDGQLQRMHKTRPEWIESMRELNKTGKRKYEEAKTQYTQE